MSLNRVAEGGGGYTMSKCQKMMLKMSEMSKQKLKCQKRKYAKKRPGL